MTRTGGTRTASRFEWFYRHFTVDWSAAALATRRVSICVAPRAWRHEHTRSTAVVVTSSATRTLRRKRVHLCPRSLSTHGGHFADSTTLPARHRRPHTATLPILLLLLLLSMSMVATAVKYNQNRDYSILGAVFQ